MSQRTFPAKLQMNVMFLFTYLYAYTYTLIRHSHTRVNSLVQIIIVFRFIPFYLVYVIPMND